MGVGRIGGSKSGGGYQMPPTREQIARAMLERSASLEDGTTVRVDARYGTGGPRRARELPLYGDGGDRMGRARRVEEGCPKFGFKSARHIEVSVESHIVDVDWGSGNNIEAWCGIQVYGRRRWSRTRAWVTCPACEALAAERVYGVEPE